MELGGRRVLIAGKKKKEEMRKKEAKGRLSFLFISRKHALTWFAVKPFPSVSGESEVFRFLGGILLISLEIGREKKIQKNRPDTIKPSANRHNADRQSGSRSR